MNCKARKRKRLDRLRRIAVGLLACLVLSLSAVMGASAEVVFPKEATVTRVYLDGREVLKGECVIIDSVTYVPLRNFCNLLDECRFSWNGVTATATVKSDHLTLTVQNNALYIIANGHYFYTVGRVMNLNGHMYVPIRPLARAFNESLSWNASARSVELTSNSGVRAVAPAAYAEDEVYWLSRIISAEAKGEPLLGQVAVGNVVLNRVRSSSYPNTIYGVIFDRKHGVQFTPSVNGTIYDAPTVSAIRAAKACLEGYSLSGSILYFFNPSLATSKWISENCTYVFRIGGHVFYR